jgi:hypothetical protein
MIVLLSLSSCRSDKKLSLLSDKSFYVGFGDAGHENSIIFVLQY